MKSEAKLFYYVTKKEKPFLLNQSHLHTDLSIRGASNGALNESLSISNYTSECTNQTVKSMSNKINLIATNEEKFLLLLKTVIHKAICAELLPETAQIFVVMMYES